VAGSLAGIVALAGNGTEAADAAAAPEAAGGSGGSTGRGGASGRASRGWSRGGVCDSRAMTTCVVWFA
jgi:hypothetical protein